jgi:hypothetical protein
VDTPIKPSHRPLPAVAGPIVSCGRRIAFTC